MNEIEDKAVESSEFRIRGQLTKKGVRIVERQNTDQLSTKGYGASEKGEFFLAFYEALYLADRSLLEVEDRKGNPCDFKKLLQQYQKTDENAWAKYLVYRDLRSRGYVVREGFGLGVDFRVYERGEYSKDTAKYLLLSIQEGKPILLEDLAKAQRQAQSLKKELVLAVMNRRGEVVYYSVSQLTMP